jgi:hypothetical protein
VVIPGAKIQLDFIFDSARISAQFVEDAVLLVRSYLTAVVEGKQLELTSRFDYSRFLNPECQVKPVGKAPDSEHEQSLVEIWRELFGDPRIGVTDNFFDLGGRSIMLPVLMSRIKARTGAVVPFVALFQDPTVRGLARHLESAPESSNRLVERGRLRADRSKSALRRASEKRARRGKNNA